jgi:hypothetical protein
MLLVREMLFNRCTTGFELWKLLCSTHNQRNPLFVGAIQGPECPMASLRNRSQEREGTAVVLSTLHQGEYGSMMAIFAQRLEKVKLAGSAGPGRVGHPRFTVSAATLHLFLAFFFRGPFALPESRRAWRVTPGYRF